MAHMVASIRRKSRGDKQGSKRKAANSLAYADRVLLPGSCEQSFGDIGTSFDELFQDAEELTRLEALSFDAVLKPRGVQTVLDCSCGTGIQALGLAALGYRVSASDISNKMIAIVKSKAKQSQLQVEAKRADFRNLRPWAGRRFDAIISGGNSLSVLGHLNEIDQVLKSAMGLLNQNGVVIIGCRDYGLLRDDRETMLPRRSGFRDGNPEWIFDLRLFGSERVRVINMFVRVVNGHWRLRSFVKSYLYLSANELAVQMKLAGLSRVEVLDVKGMKPYEGGEWYLVVGAKRRLH